MGFKGDTLFWESPYKLVVGHTLQRARRFFCCRKLSVEMASYSLRHVSPGDVSGDETSHETSHETSPTTYTTVTEIMFLVVV